jgi:DNA repair photolyase
MQAMFFKGRGSVTRPAHRFERDARDAFDDGWGTDMVAAQSGAPVPETQVRVEEAKSAVSHNDSPDIYFDHGLNPYRGCEHGCVYCYARPTHSYLNLSPGLDFETQLIAKTNLASVLARELMGKSYRPKLIAVGAATDGYQPIEREWRITRQCIEVMALANQPVAIVTKGAGVERDIDLLAPMAAKNQAAVYVTITTLDARLARILEPRAAAPHRRLRAIRTLAEAGIPVGVSVAPQIPFITDDMEAVLEAAASAGARCAFYTVLRLPWELNGIFQAWLQTHYPDRAARVMARVREMHGISEGAAESGKVYDAAWASRMKGKGLWADLIRQRFDKTCQRLGLNRQRAEHDVSRFDPTALADRFPGGPPGQQRLF